VFVTATLEIAVDCPECKLAVPVDRIAASVTCVHCASEVPLSWKKILDIGDSVDAIDRAIALAPNERETGVYASIHLEVTHGEVRCRHCGADLPLDDLAASLRDERDAHCPRCRSPVPMRAAPAELVAVHPSARAVLFERGTSGERATGGDLLGAPAVRCVACGAELRLSGSERTIACAYCRASNYLPDEVWTRLRPGHRIEPLVVASEVDEAHVFAVRYLVGSRSVAERDATRRDLPHAQMLGLARYQDAEVQLALLANPACTKDVLRVLAESDSREVRDAVERHPYATPDVLSAMRASMESRVIAAGADGYGTEWSDIASDPRATPRTLAILAQRSEPDVRALVAANPNTATDVAVSLQRDSAREVRVALASRSDLPVTVLDALASDADAHVRKAIATRETLPAEIFVQLAADTDHDVLRALTRNPNTPADALRELARCEDEKLARAAREHRNHPRKWWQIF
jgi:Zn finger protein HypA/HybF involved in hydrogenase expression